MNSVNDKDRDAKQRHHDYYVTLKRQGQLKSEDEAQYELAMQRERDGEVDPLPE
jgi:hypothetical protein